MYLNAKMKPVETISGLKGERDEGERWRGKFKYNIFDTL
jgi:hypothetical protein